MVETHQAGFTTDGAGDIFDLTPQSSVILVLMDPITQGNRITIGNSMRFLHIPN